MSRPVPTSASARRGAVNKGCLIAGAVLVILVFVAYGTVKGAYNTFVTAEETVDAQWAELESAYRRRFDLIPQLVSVVQGAADFEQETFSAVTEARAQVGQIQLPEGAPTDPGQLEEFMAAQRGLGSALGRLLVAVEAYPQLQATQAFRDLQAQVEGTENRINVERGDYIRAVQEYNTTLRTFPNTLLAGLFGFEKRPQLQQEAGVDEAPVIEFGGAR